MISRCDGAIALTKEAAAVAAGSAARRQIQKELKRLPQRTCVPAFFSFLGPYSI